MRRITALIISVVVLITVILPAGSFAAGDDKGLETAIRAAKGVFVIPDDYKFDYNVYTDSENKNVWYLTWQSKDGSSASISVRVDDTGKILGYDSWKDTYYSQTKKFPKVSNQEAKRIADEFLAKVNPAAASIVKYQENTQDYLNDSSYYFNYYRTENGIPYYNNSVNISVNKNSGEVTSYYLNWTDGLVFPSAKGVIGIEEAQQYYKDNIGLKLMYRYAYENDAIKLYAVYTPAFDNNYAIDALTGEKVKLAEGYYGPYYGGMEEMASKAMDSLRGQSQNLTPEELKAVEETSKLITKDQAEKIARDSKYTGLTADFILESSNLSREYPVRTEFSWYLSFRKEAAGTETENKYVSVTINARTGEIKGFYVSAPYSATAVAKYDKAVSKKAAEDFLKEFKPELFSQSEYDEDAYGYIIYESGVKPTQYSFRYVRKVNGAYFPDNYLNVDYDAVNGKVTGFNMNWFDIEFPSIDKAVDKSMIYGKMFSEIGLELQYKAKYTDTATLRILPRSAAIPELVLVYALKPNKPNYFDINDGTLLNYDGKPYKETKPVVYTDIKGHYAENKINALAENGIYLEGTEFKPDQAINQLDYLMLVSKVMANSYWQPLTLNSTQQEIDNFYSYMIREGVLKQEEKDPKAVVNRETAVKFMINALKYGEVAQLKDIYIVDFKDKSEISTDLTGYVAIAQGFKIISGDGGRFNPKNNLTRAEAAVMIYNYLQR